MPHKRASIDQQVQYMYILNQGGGSDASVSGHWILQMI